MPPRWNSFSGTPFNRGSGMIKVIAFDLDGTLLGRDHTVAAETLRWLHAARQRGIRLVAVSGRNEGEARKVLEGAELALAWITCNGAKTTDPHGETVCVRPMTEKSIRRVQETCRAYMETPLWWGEREQYCVGRNADAEKALRLRFSTLPVRYSPEEIRRLPAFRRMLRAIRVVPSLDALLREEQLFYKAVVVCAERAAAAKLREALAREPGVAVAATTLFDVEVTDEKAQKGPALDRLIRRWGYTRREVMALGDSLNDLSMLEMDFGATVAMANAPLRVKQVAKYTTKSNEELGVAFAIEQLLARQEG